MPETTTTNNTPTAITFGKTHIGAIIGGNHYTTNTGNPNFEAAYAAASAGKWGEYITLCTPAKAVSEFVSNTDEIEVRDGAVYFQGEEVNGVVVNRILDYVSSGVDKNTIVKPLVKFLRRLLENPSYTAVQELFTFLDHRHLPITTEGRFLAYKSVRPDFYDHHSGKFLNTVGTTIEMPRRNVDDNRRLECSNGFHVGTFEYARDFHSHNRVVMEVEVDPADVVSVPSDGGATKCRTCRYKVVRQMEVVEPITDHLVTSRWEDAEDFDDDFEDEEPFEDISEAYDRGYNDGFTEGQKDAQV